MRAETTFTIEDNTDEVLKALAEQIETALTAIGITAETHAKEEITRQGAVDTGRLRNSITHALSGKEAAVKTYSDDKGNTFSYEGIAPQERGENAVYVGTNVEYGAFVELGTTKMKARPFLKPAVTEHNDEYKQIIKAALGK